MLRGPNEGTAGEEVNSIHTHTHTVFVMSTGDGDRDGLQQLDGDVDVGEEHVI